MVQPDLEYDRNKELQRNPAIRRTCCMEMDVMLHPSTDSSSCARWEVCVCRYGAEYDSNSEYNRVEYGGS